MISGDLWSLHKHENLHFDNDEDIHLSPKNYEEGNYTHDLDLVIISHWLRVSYPTRKWVQREKCMFKVHLT